MGQEQGIDPEVLGTVNGSLHVSPWETGATGACKPRALGPLELEVLGWKLPHQQFADVVAVLKDRFCYCLGISRPIDQETIASEETGCYFHRSQRQGALPSYARLYGETPGSVRR